MDLFLDFSNSNTQSLKQFNEKLLKIFSFNSDSNITIFLKDFNFVVKNDSYIYMFFTDKSGNILNKNHIFFQNECVYDLFGTPPSNINTITLNKGMFKTKEDMAQYVSNILLRIFRVYINIIFI